MMKLVRRAVFTAALSATVSTALAFAQTPDCTYDACALRIRQGFFSGAVVQGTKAQPVTALGWFPPRIDLLANAADSTRHHYLTFRTQYGRAAALNTLGLALTAAAGWVYGSNSSANKDLATGLFISGLVFGIGGSASRVSAVNHLEQAIWLYNRTLPRDR